MISDDAWVDAYLGKNRAALGGAYRAVAGALAAAGIRFAPAEAGFFVLCDLRRHLEAPSFEAEDTLWRRLLAAANVNLTPGRACRIAEPGFFRLCFAGVAPETAVAAVRRLAEILL